MAVQWHSAQVFHHDPGGTDGLLLGGVRPLLEALEGKVGERLKGAYFVRHWLRGPHVRVSVRTDPDTWEGSVQPLIDEIVGGYLRAHPSGGHPNPEHERKAHERLAELELESGPLEPWYPDNSIQYAPYDRRLHVLGTEEAAELLARFHADTTPLAFRILAEHPAGAARLDVLLGLMFATAQAACPPLTKGYLSYRSHAEGFLANASDSAGMRARFEKVYEANRELLAARMRAAVAAVGGEVDLDAGGGAGDGGPEGSGDVPYAGEWIELVRRYKAEAERLQPQGKIPLPSFANRSAAGNPAGWDNVSPFHQALDGNEWVRNELDSAAWFAVYRVLLNYQYLLFSRLGVKPAARFMLCHLAARTVEEAYDLSLDSVIGRLEDSAATWRVPDGRSR